MVFEVAAPYCACEPNPMNRVNNQIIIKEEQTKFNSPSFLNHLVEFIKQCEIHGEPRLNTKIKSMDKL